MTDKQIIIDGIDVSGCEECEKLKAKLTPKLKNAHCAYKDVISKFLHKRILYINNKLSNCIGYSPAEKKIRIEELQGLLKIVENTPEAKSEFVSEVNISELLKVSRQNTNCYYKQAIDDIEKLINKLKCRTPLFEMKEIAKDIIAILDIINKAKEQE